MARPPAPSFASSLKLALTITAFCCVFSTITALAYSNRGSPLDGGTRRHAYRDYHGPDQTQDALIRGSLCGLAIGAGFSIFLIAARAWGAHRDPLKQVQRALEENADKARRDGRHDDEQRLRREIADMERERARG
jgi:hypothetical protein